MSTKVGFNAIVSEPVFVNSETMILRVKPDGWELPDYSPGQFTILGLPGRAPRIPAPLADVELDPPDPDKFLMRAYSVASSSRRKDYLEFYITLIRSGSLTPRLFALKGGDRIYMGRKIRGLFTLSDTPENMNLVLMATGTGLAPYMSMIRTFLKSSSSRRFAIVHGARHSWDLGYRSELSMLARLVGHFDYVPVISRPSEETIPWKGETGHVQDVWKRGVIAERWGMKPTPENTNVFLCGNPNMIQSTLEILEKEGFREHTKRQPGEIHSEKWW